MDAADLARWTRFAAKGGIGKCTAMRDCVAERPEDLMFLKDDEVTVLMQLPDQDGLYLGYCEDVVGRFQGSHVRFHSKLKKPVMTKRASTANSVFSKGSSSSPSPSIIPSQDSESSSLRVVLSSPPPLVVPAHMSPPSSSPVLPTSPSNVSPDNDLSVWPSNSYSSTSSASDSILDTPPATHGFDASNFGNSKAEDPPYLVDNGSQMSPDSTDVTSTHRESEQSTYDFEEPSTRISAALSDGEIGIGLSLLQDIANGSGEDRDDWSSIGSGRSESQTPDLKSFESLGSTAEGHPPLVDATQRLSSTEVAPPQTRPAAQSRPSSRSVSIQRPQSDLDDWEGASDIYENYRYSRHSMTSKMSSYSQGSASEAPPPVPRPSERRESIDSQSQYSRSSSATSSLVIPSRAQSQGPLGATTGLSIVSVRKDRPASLHLSSSPILHAAFAAPIISPGTESTTSPHISSIFSSTTVSPTSGVGGSDMTPHGQLESGHALLVGTQTSVDLQRSGDIVIEDDEEPPDISSTDDSRQDGSFASESTFSDKETVSAHLELPKGSVLESEGLPLSPDTSEPPNNPPLSPLSSFPLPPRQPQLRPALSEFITTHPGSSRTSLFLPHPNAPKSTSSPSGPMYAREPLRPSQALSSNVPGSSIISILHQAAAARFAPNGQMRRLTIYGRFERDLMSSDGPVRIVFSLEPPPPHSPPGLSGAIPLNINKRSFSPGMTPSVSSPLARDEISNPPSPQPLLSVPSSGIARDLTTSPIPRAGFNPQAKGVRPRSRSFSSINTQMTEVSQQNYEPTQLESSFDRMIPPSVMPAQATVVGRAQSVSPQPSSTSSERIVASLPLSAHSSHAPSPLSTSHSESTRSPRGSVSPLSPMLSPTSHGSSPIPSPPFQPAPNNLRKASSSTALTGELTAPSPSSTPPLRIPRRNASFAAQQSSVPPTSASIPHPRRSASLAPESLNASPISSSMFPPTNTSRTNRSRIQDPSSQARSLASRQDSIDTTSSISQLSDARVTSPLPNGSSGLARNTSLRKKLSLPSIRSRSIQISRQEDSVTSPISNNQDNEMVQAGNIEFELVRPIIPQVPSTRSSEDSAFAQRENVLLHPESKPNITGLLRTDSPAISTLSGASTVPRSPIGDSVPTSKVPKSDTASSMDAHRQRELKWMALISSVPAAQARKNKKVKKLLMEGVPSSVRYLVWAHLTDSKAKGMPGLYLQLGKRGKVPMFNDIERDAQKCFPDQPQLHTVPGTLVSLLQAYLSMVPDIQYETGLTYIAGRLLILAPDEDAFWIFVSLMDTHLRPWFSNNTIQMEVDASLFSKALENNDPQVSKKLYVDLGISQSAVCRPWFSSLFAHSLPVDHLHRVWDIFLYEGVAFLFRVGLAMVYCCRRYLLQSSSETSALTHLGNPPPSCLPSTPDAFINLAYSFKLKHDDIRKQRIKMEAQVKRQTQTRVLSAPGLGGAKPGAAISLPR